MAEDLDDLLNLAIPAHHRRQLVECGQPVQIRGEGAEVHRQLEATPQSLVARGDGAEMRFEPRDGRGRLDAVMPQDIGWYAARLFQQREQDIARLDARVAGPARVVQGKLAHEPG